jgi:hypothetical protein
MAIWRDYLSHQCVEVTDFVDATGLPMVRACGTGPSRFSQTEGPERIRLVKPVLADQRHVDGQAAVERVEVADLGLERDRAFLSRLPGDEIDRPADRIAAVQGEVCAPRFSSQHSVRVATTNAAPSLVLRSYLLRQRQKIRTA